MERVLDRSKGPRQENQNAAEKIETLLDPAGKIVRAAKKIAFKKAPLGIDHEDLLAEALVRAWRDWPRFDPTKSSARTFVSLSLKYGIADAVRNLGRVSRAACNKDSKMSEIDRRQANAVAWPSSLTPPDWFTSISTNQHDGEWCQLPVAHKPFSAFENSEEIAKILRGLPRKQRLALCLHYLEDLTQKEIGVTLGISESRVCQLVAAALATLRERLRPA